MEGITSEREEVAGKKGRRSKKMCTHMCKCIVETIAGMGVIKKSSGWMNSSMI
jgi:hypothetical protein